MTTTTTKLFEFKFYDGQVFRGRGVDPRDALRRLGLGAYNPVAYEVREVPDEKAKEGDGCGREVRD